LPNYAKKKCHLTDYFVTSQIARTEGGWGSEKEFKDMKLATPVSEGWLFSKDSETVRIFAGYDVESDGSIHFSERSVFPTSCVKKITRIH
jgi:hypothetical protein